MNQSYQKNEQDAVIDPVADLLGGGRVVAFKVDLGLALGSATAGLWLSQLWFWANTAQSARTDKKRWDGEWMSWTQDEITEQTALTRRESDTARRDLRAVGVLVEDKRGLPMRIWYRIDKAKLYQLLRAYCDKNGVATRATTNLGAFRQDEESDAPDNVGGNVQSILAQNANLYAQNRQPVQSDAPANLGGKRQPIIRSASASESSLENSIYQEEQQQINQPARTEPMPVAPPDAVAATSQNKNAEFSELVALVVEKVAISEKSAASIVKDTLLVPNGAEVVRRNAMWWPKSGRAEKARSAGAVFRSCVEDDWAKAAYDEKHAKQKEGDQQFAHRRYVQVPADFAKSETSDARSTGNMARLGEIVAQVASKRDAGASPSETTPDAVWSAISDCAQQRAHQQAIKNAIAKSPSVWKDDITKVPYNVAETATGRFVGLVKSERNLILREMAKEPRTLNSKIYYDRIDHLEASKELDF